jgi:hypothetical protein
MAFRQSTDLFKQDNASVPTNKLLEQDTSQPDRNHHREN